MRRSARMRIYLFAVAALALILAGLAFTVQIIQNTHRSAQLTKIQAEHCRTDARQDNSQRALDLALIADDQDQIATLLRLRRRPQDGDDEAVLTSLLDYYQRAERARAANLPAYENPAQC